MVELFKRTRHYNRDDYRKVRSICLPYESSNSLWTTPHVLTEVSNLLNQLGEPASQECRRGLSSFVAIAEEQFVEARPLARLPAFAQFGITDAAITQLAAEDIAVFTDDFALAGFLKTKDIPVLNLRVMRSYEAPGVEL